MQTSILSVTWRHFSFKDSTQTSCFLSLFFVWFVFLCFFFSFSFLFLFPVPLNRAGWGRNLNSKKKNIKNKTKTKIFGQPPHKKKGGREG